MESGIQNVRRHKLVGPCTRGSRLELTHSSVELQEISTSTTAMATSKGKIQGQQGKCWVLDRRELLRAHSSCVGLLSASDQTLLNRSNSLTMFPIQQLAIAKPEN